MTKNQKSPAFVDATDTPLSFPFSSPDPPAAATAAVVLVGRATPPASVDVDNPFSVMVWYTVAPPGVQVSMHLPPLVHAGGTGHIVVVSEGCHDMCQGAWACVHEDTTVSAIVVASSMTLMQGWVAHAMGQSVAE